MIFGDVPRSDYDQLEISFPTETKTTSLRSFSWLQGGWLVARSRDLVNYHHNFRSSDVLLPRWHHLLVDDAPTKHAQIASGTSRVTPKDSIQLNATWDKPGASVFFNMIGVYQAHPLQIKF